MLVMIKKRIGLREESENRGVGRARLITTRNYTNDLIAFLL